MSMNPQWLGPGDAFMCELCFATFPAENASYLPDGSQIDVCVPCAERDIESLQHGYHEVTAVLAGIRAYRNALLSEAERYSRYAIGSSIPDQHRQTSHVLGMVAVELDVLLGVRLADTDSG